MFAMLFMQRETSKLIRQKTKKCRIYIRDLGQRFYNKNYITLFRKKYFDQTMQFRFKLMSSQSII